MDVVGAGEEKTMTNWEVGEAFFLFAGEFEHIRKYIYGRSGLLE